MISQHVYLSLSSVAIGSDIYNYVGLNIKWISHQVGTGWGTDESRPAKYYISLYGGDETEEWSGYSSLPEETYDTIIREDTHYVRRPAKGDKSRIIRVRAWMDTGVNGAEIIETIATIEVAPRNPLIWRVDDRSLGEACLVEYSRGYSTSVPGLGGCRLRFTIGGFSHEVRPREGLPGTDAVSHTYTGYTLPYEIASQVTNSTTGTMTVTLFEKRSDALGNEIETIYDTATFAIKVPNNEYTRPAVSMVLSPLSGLPSPYNGLYIQGHSRVKAALAFDTKYGATVAESSISVNGKPYGAPYESDLLGSPGKVTVQASVKDSRGFTGTVSGEIEVIAYERPYIRAASGYDRVICDRCDAYANLTDEGKFLKIVAGMVYSKILSGGVQYNYGKIKFRYRKENGEYSDWSTILDTKTAKVDEVITNALLSGRLDLETNYQVQIVAVDDLYETVPITFSISSDYVYMDRPAGGKSMGLGGYASGDGRLDVYWRFIARGGFSALDKSGVEIPIDSSMPIPKGEISEGWSPDNLDAGVYVIGHDIGLTSGGTVLMKNGVLIQMNGIADGAVKAQIALPRDENASPKYRLCWFSAWGGWRDMKL